MMEKEEKTYSTTEHLKQVFRLRIKLYKYLLLEKAAQVSASIVSSLFIIIMLFLCILFASIALALVIGEYSGHSWLGFTVVAGVYLILFGLFKIYRKKWLKKGFLDFFIDKMFEQ